MRTDNAFRALFLLIAFCGLAFAQSRWCWFPVNTNQTSGFTFYFENPPAPEATVTISGKRAGVPFTVTKAIGTDKIHSADHSLFAFDVVNIDNLEVNMIKIEMNGLQSTVANPKTGIYYQF